MSNIRKEAREWVAKAVKEAAIAQFDTLKLNDDLPLMVKPVLSPLKGKELDQMVKDYLKEREKYQRDVETGKREPLDDDYSFTDYFHKQIYDIKRSNLHQYYNKIAGVVMPQIESLAATHGEDFKQAALDVFHELKEAHTLDETANIHFMQHPEDMLQGEYQFTVVIEKGLIWLAIQQGLQPQDFANQDKKLAQSILQEYRDMERNEPSVKNMSFADAFQGNIGIVIQNTGKEAIGILDSALPTFLNVDDYVEIPENSEVLYDFDYYSPTEFTVDKPVQFCSSMVSRVDVSGEANEERFETAAKAESIWEEDMEEYSWVAKDMGLDNLNLVFGCDYIKAIREACHPKEKEMG